MRTRLYQPTGQAITLLAKALRQGKLVAVPTETVYGLAGNALDSRACRGIFKAKGRPANDPLIVHLLHAKDVAEIAVTSPQVSALAKAFWPGPLTLVLPKQPVVPDIVTSGRPSVAVRIPSHRIFRRLLKEAGLPLAAPSANPFGYISPTTAAHVSESLGGKIPYILDGGPCEVGVESTILDLRDPTAPVLLRPGAIEQQAIEKILGCRVRRPARKSTSARKAALAPGMLSRHYSPNTPLILHSKLNARETVHLNQDEAIVFFKKPSLTSLRRRLRPAAAGAEGKRAVGTKNVFWLSKKGDLTEAARQLFASLRQLDHQRRWKRIHVELAPGRSALAEAINDRLTRAAAKR